MIAQASVIALDILLFVTLIYLAALMRKLKSFQSHKADMRAIVDDVITATESARTAVDKLKFSVAESHTVMAQHFDEARKVELAIESRIAEASKLLSDLHMIKSGTAIAEKRRPAEPMARASAHHDSESRMDRTETASRSDMRSHASFLATHRVVEDESGEEDISRRLASISDAVKSLRSKVAQSL